VFCYLGLEYSNRRVDDFVIFFHFFGMISLPATLTGIVQHGNKRGRLLGYPTANIPVITNLPDGVYVGWVYLDSQRHIALCFFGKNETFDEHDRKLEAHILDFAGDLYGQAVSVELHHFIRPPQKFTTAEALILEMQQDEVQARAWAVQQ